MNDRVREGCIESKLIVKDRQTIVNIKDRAAGQRDRNKRTRQCV